MTRKIKHLTPRYIKNRLLVMLDEKLNPTHPWLTKDAVAFLDSMIKPDDVGVEFGSGRSTIWFANRMKHLTSIEKHAGWYEKVVRMLQDHGLSHKVDYHHCDDDATYAAQANSLADNSIDFCLVDGAAREHCTLNMLPKMRSGGLLVIDNINWYLPNDRTSSPASRRTKDGNANADWDKIVAEIGGWRRYWTSNGVSDTCIWIKP